MIEQLLARQTSEALKKLYGDGPSPGEVSVEKTRKEQEGDFTIIAFPFTRYSKKSPESTGQELGAYLKQAVPEIREAGVIKGFLNLILDDSFWIRFLEENIGDPRFGLPEPSGKDPVLVEFSSPNTNKPLHLGHIRNNLLGYSLSEILKAAGHRVIRLNLVNDRGIHICKSMLAYQKWGNGETPQSAGMKSDHLIGKYYVLFDRKYKEEIAALVSRGMEPEEAEKQAPLILEAQELLVKWENNDPETRALWEQMNRWAYEGFGETYRRLGIVFDNTEYESQVYLMGKDIVRNGMQEGHFIRKEDGSIWADLTGYGADEKLLLRADGTSVYITQDLGTAENRYRHYHPSVMIYVVGNEQIYHFEVLKKVLTRLGKDWAEKIYHLSYGMVELPEGKMKSREGTVVDADDLIGEMEETAERTTRELGKANEMEESEAKQLFHTIGMGALKYFILKVDPKKNMLFDPQESIDFNGNTGPFIQYTYARIQSLLRKAGEAGYAAGGSGSGPYNLLPGEKRIIKLIYRFPETLQQAALQLSPALIANHIYELAKEYNQFYQEVPVLKAEDPAAIGFRVKLSFFAGEIIRRSMALLGIGVPQRM